MNFTLWFSMPFIYWLPPTYLNHFPPYSNTLWERSFYEQVQRLLSTCTNYWPECLSPLTFSLQYRYYYGTYTDLFCNWLTFRLFPVSGLTKRTIKISWCLLMLKYKTASFTVLFQNTTAHTRAQLSIKVIPMFHNSQQEYFTGLAKKSIMFFLYNGSSSA